LTDQEGQQKNVLLAETASGTRSQELLSSFLTGKKGYGRPHKFAISLFVYFIYYFFTTSLQLTLQIKVNHIYVTNE